MIDRVEAGRLVSPHLRVAFEVVDAVLSRASWWMPVPNWWRPDGHAVGLGELQAAGAG